MKPSLAKLFASLAVVGAVAPATAALVSYEQAVLSKNPYLYYRMGEASGGVAIDASANGRDGTHVGGPTLGVPGAIGGDTAIDYDGVNDHTLTGDVGAFGQALANHSIEFVIGGLSDSASRSRPIAVYSEMNAMALQVSFNLGNAAGETSLFLREAQNNRRHVIVFDESEVDLYDGEFHHVVFAFDQSRDGGGATPADRLEIFVNGTLLTSSVTTLVSDTEGSYLNFDQELAIGARSASDGTVDEFGDIVIDEFALHTVTLSGADVAEHYRALVVPEPSSFMAATVALAGLLNGRRRRCRT